MAAIMGLRLLFYVLLGSRESFFPDCGFFDSWMFLRVASFEGRASQLVQRIQAVEPTGSVPQAGFSRFRGLEARFLGPIWIKALGTLVIKVVHSCVLAWDELLCCQQGAGQFV